MQDSRSTAAGRDPYWSGARVNLKRNASVTVSSHDDVTIVWIRQPSEYGKTKI